MQFRRVIGPDGYPIEQAADMFSRKDDLLVQIDRNLKALIALHGGTPGTSGTPGSPAAPAFISDNLRIATVPLGAANTEVAFRFPTGTKQISIHARNGNAIRISSEMGKVAGANDPYFTLKANTAYATDNFLIPENNAVTWYFSCSVANEVVEIIIGD